MEGVTGRDRQREDDEGENADDDCRRDAVKREAEAGDRGRHGGDEKQERPAIHRVGAEKPEEDDKAGDDPDETQNNVHERVGVHAGILAPGFCKCRSRFFCFGSLTGSAVGETLSSRGKRHPRLDRVSPYQHSLPMNDLLNGARGLGPRGITVNNVQPGPIDTEVNPADGEFAETLKSFMAVPRYGTVEEVAGMEAYLAGPEAAFVTRAHLMIDGGFSA